MATSFEREYERLNPAQRQAVDTIEGPVLVIAGPGTGKTQLLSMRVANILRRTDVNANNILCLTFTESGQRAIQQRLLELIGEAGARVSIHTFHAFGAAIITANPQFFYDTSQSRAADDLTLFEILQGIFERLPHGGPLSSQKGDEFLFLKDVQERISQLKTAGISPDELRLILKHDRSWCKLATPLIQRTYGQFTRFHKKYVPLLQDLAGELSDLQTDDSPLPWLQPLAHACLTELQAALAVAETDGSSTPVSKWKARWLETVNDQLQLKAQTQHDRLEALAHIYEQYTASLRQRHLFDYDDMILEVLHALEQQPELRASLQEQFQYILVDEYQDTNGAQARILELLADNPVHEGRPNIMVVGDDDQAIYGFQGADVSVMLHFRERWRDVTVIVLTDNYRSNQPILDIARQLILQGESRLENYYPDIVKQLTARPNTPEHKPRLVVFEQETDQYHWLVEELRRLLAAGTAPETIALIAPRHKYLQRLLPHLLAAGIDVAYERQTNVLTDPLTRQFLQLSTLVDAVARHRHSEVQSLLPEVLSYDWWDIVPERLWQLSLGNETETTAWLPRMLRSHYPALRAIAEWLQAMAEASTHEPLEAMLEQLMQHLKGKPDTARLQSNLETIVRGLQQYRPNQPLHLHDFVRYVTLSRQAGLSITTKEVTATSDHAVQLLTAHKAKGLEFEHVYLLHVTQHVWLTERGMINKIGLPPNLFAVQPAGETNDDHLRLLYVAATRARHGLAFISYGRAEDGRDHLLLDWLTVAPLQGLIEEHAPRVQPQSPILPVNETYDWRQRHHASLTQPSPRKQLQPYLERYRLSPTHVLTFLDVTRGGPRQFLVRHLLQFPEALSVNMIFGNALHQTLEQAQAAINRTGKLPSNEALLEHFQTALATYNVRKTENRKLLDRAERTLRFYMEQRSGGFTKQNLAEQNFSTEQVNLGEVRLTGKIDRLWLDPKGRTAVVTDFKTGKPFSKWQATAEYDKHKLHRYRQQLLFYKLLVESSKSFRTFTVQEGVLEFVEADKWGRVSSLSYTYNAAEQARLEQLLAVIWQKIMRLDLPDTSGYAPDFRGVLAFEQDLLDGKI